MTASALEESRLNVVIAGGGIAALEAALALSELARDRVSVTLLAPREQLTLRPLALAEQLGAPRAGPIPLSEVARAADAELLHDSFKWVELSARTVHTAGGLELSYEALLLAMGARLRPAFGHAITVDDARMAEQVAALLAEVDAGAVSSVAFVVPWPMPWPLPAYELALLVARHARAAGRDLRVELVTPEEAPLALFGSEASRAVARQLELAGIRVTTTAHCGVPQPGLVSIHPGPRMLRVDRIVALPQLFGPPTPGIPGSAHDGFVQVDQLCRVHGAPGVYAAGDATDFPVKHGSVAAQQADAAARAIAVQAGVQLEPVQFEPELVAVLLGGERPLRLQARFGGTRGVSSQAWELGTGAPAPRLSARYLTPFIEALIGSAVIA